MTTSAVEVELADGRKSMTSKNIKIKNLELGTYHTSGIDAQVMKLQRYDVILGKSWLYHANPTIDWRTNTLIFTYGHKKIVVEAVKTANETSCGFIYISNTKQLPKVPNVVNGNFAIRGNNIKSSKMKKKVSPE